MIRRLSEEALKEFSTGYPLIAISGPRQSGKTTLARYLFSDKPYVSLENPDYRELALNDPRGFLAAYRGGAVFDEVQRCPELLSYLQQIVDESPVPGSFVLTGSQQFGLLSGITQSLAGRVALVQLMPFAMAELYPAAPITVGVDTMLFTGLYPPVHDRKLKPHAWYANYLQTYIERDVRQMVNVRDLNSFQRFVRLCAGRTGQILNLSDLATDCGISHNTAKAWISILEASYIIFLLQPFHRNFSKRLIKAPKLYFYDTGLAVWLLGLQSPEQVNLHPMRGALFETLIIGEFIKTRFNRGLASNLTFWRDRSGNEIDLVVETGLRAVPVEIKSGKTINADFFKGLKKWSALAGEAAGTPVLVYAGDESLEHAGVHVRSWRDCEGMLRAAGELAGGASSTK